jgi:hypothetical protein
MQSQKDYIEKQKYRLMNMASKVNDLRTLVFKLENVLENENVSDKVILDKMKQELKKIKWYQEELDWHYWYYYIKPEEETAEENTLF